MGTIWNSWETQWSGLLQLEQIDLEKTNLRLLELFKPLELTRELD